MAKKQANGAIRRTNKGQDQPIIDRLVKLGCKKEEIDRWVNEVPPSHLLAIAEGRGKAFDLRELLKGLRAQGANERDDNQRRAEQILVQRGKTPTEAHNELLDYRDVLKLLAAEETTRPAPAPPPLSPAAAAMYELLLKLPPHRAMTGKEIADELNRRDPKLLVDESALRGRHASELQAYGLENQPRIGYRINPARRTSAK